jgi:hypothetical protein
VLYVIIKHKKGRFPAAVQRQEVILKRLVLSVSDTESGLCAGDKLRRSQVVERFELSAKVGGLFKAQFQSHHLYWLAGKQ